MQDSLIMENFNKNEDDRSKKKLKKESFIKADVLLIKNNVMLPMILPGPEDKLFPKNCNPEQKYNFKTKKSRNSKEEIFSSTDKLNRKMKSLSFEANVTNDKNLIEEKKSAPSRLQKFTSDNFSSEQKFKKIKSFIPHFESSNHNLSGEKSIFVYNYSKKLLPTEKKMDSGLQIELQNSLDLVKNKATDRRQFTNSVNFEDKAQQTLNCKSKNIKSKYSECEKDTNTLNIFTLFNNQRNNSDKLNCQKKYSWQDIDNWLNSSKNEEIINTKDGNLEDFNCKVTYSWQVLGIGTQTSNDFLQNDANDKYQCTIKYSWQIVGTSTQASLNNQEDYWKGLILSPRKNYNAWNKIKSSNEFSNSRNKILILYCEKTQTLSDERTQTEQTDCRVKYSWENLIKQRMGSLKSTNFDSPKNISYDNYCVKYLRTRMEPIKCSKKYSWENLISQRLN